MAEGKLDENDWYFQG